MPLKALHPDIYSNALHLKQQQKFAENSADKRIGVIKQWSQRIRPKIANDEPGTNKEITSNPSICSGEVVGWDSAA